MVNLFILLASMPADANWALWATALTVGIPTIGFFSHLHTEEKITQASYKNPITFDENWAGIYLKVCELNDTKVLLQIGFIDPDYPIPPRKQWFLKNNIPKELQNQDLWFKAVKTKEEALSFSEIKTHPVLSVAA